MNHKLSSQAVGAIMMALQKSLIEQSDIVPVLEGFKMTNSPVVSIAIAEGNSLNNLAI